MNLINSTDLEAGFTMGLAPDGRELLIVVVKGTYAFPNDPEQIPELAEEQVPLVQVDEFTGEPGLSAPLYEIDFAPRKPRCDILLNGSAYAPEGKASERVSVSLRVGAMAKSFDVVGDRVWQAGAFLTTVSKAKPFVSMPISYNNAFGGIDKSQQDPLKFRWYPTNHAGVGYHEFTGKELIDGKPLPNTEERGQAITQPQGTYRPMAFGALGRAWQPRPKFAGTYDQAWLDRQAPFLPNDFNELYYQASPEDQQIDHPSGGETVELVNLTPRGMTRFRLPYLEVTPGFVLKRGAVKEMRSTIDTVVIEPDLERFMVTWRASLPIRRNIHEIREVRIGKSLRDAAVRRRLAKRRFESLEELIVWKRNQQSPHSG